MAIDASLIGRRILRALHAAAWGAAVIAVLSIGGCDGASDVREDQETAQVPMTEDEFVEHVAALTLAVEEGLSGEEAIARAAELGAAHYTRDEIEAFADVLREDPERWVEVAARIDRRIAELRGADPGGSAQPAESDEHGGDASPGP